MFSVSAIFGSKIPLTSSTIAPPPSQRLLLGGGNGGLTIECSSRPQKKATAHHMKTRPKKTNPADRRHGPAVYPPLPPLPAEWTLLAAADTFSEAAEPDASSPKFVEAE